MEVASNADTRVANADLDVGAVHDRGSLVKWPAFSERASHRVVARQMLFNSDLVDKVNGRAIEVPLDQVRVTLKA